MAHLTDPERTQALVNRVRRIGGQLQAVERALEGGADCAVTLQRVAAVRGAVAGLMDEIMLDHLRAHVAAPGLSDAERQRGADELAAVLSRYAK
ncbi:metal/formaldehyde-sensitive transcriptional repressor [Roseomonas haemaphysalidis]|uniref:Metal/formaldehyde-sensitive transcriptional repressor n=1 Tax=Roseomonas haemaphysalidis TaxID=2768162 RepID=A0ABS3KNC1_9PROT|nr:metal/formaldehyde-sensitive transcriptional repressor [Roseomonas haemaphysalidis]MBO1078930.1 metal/formaldehyde-sensitive transcriptional repressor [Roseomonas haemaphysalidis]